MAGIHMLSPGKKSLYPPSVSYIKMKHVPENYFKSDNVKWTGVTNFLCKNNRIIIENIFPLLVYLKVIIINNTCWKSMAWAQLSLYPSSNDILLAVFINSGNISSFTFSENL